MTVVNLKLVGKDKKALITMIASGKGGVGRTWLAITLADALNQAGKRVLLVDGDLAMANIDIQLGLMPTLDLGHFLHNQATIEDVIHKNSGVDVLAGRSGSAELGALPEVMFANFMNQIKELAQKYDHIIIDTGAGFNEISKHFASIADKCLMVLTCEPTAIINAYSFIKSIKPTNDSLSFNTIVNQADSAAEGEQTYNVLTNICQKFLAIDPTLLGIIPHDKTVRDSIQNQVLHALKHPDSEALHGVRQVAKNLLT